MRAVSGRAGRVAIWLIAAERISACRLAKCPLCLHFATDASVRLTTYGVKAIKYLTIIGIVSILSSCASALVPHSYNSTPSISSNSYTEVSSTKGVVLLSANWSREWNCGGFENAELRSIGFDILPAKYSNDKQPPDFVVNGSADYPGFINYAFLLEPGTYAISHIQIKVANSVSEIGYLNATRSQLLETGTPRGGTFNVDAKEVVYLGHFHLDCAQGPKLWRYYIDSKPEFNRYIKSSKNQYPFLDTERVEYRLFKTNEFGTSFDLQ